MDLSDCTLRGELSSFFARKADFNSSHLLLHDDSISTRLVSYILYLPNSPLDAPSSSTANLEPSASVTFLKGWDPAWGGSLELYPVGNGEDVGMPGSTPVGKVDVKWGQIVFFEVRGLTSYRKEMLSEKRYNQDAAIMLLMRSLSVTVGSD